MRDVLSACAIILASMLVGLAGLVTVLAAVEMYRERTCVTRLDVQLYGGYYANGVCHVGRS